MANDLDEVTKEDLDEVLPCDAIDEDDDCFYLYNGDDVDIWDAVESINEKLAPFGLGFATGCDDDYGFAKLFRIKE